MIRNLRGQRSASEFKISQRVIHYFSPPVSSSEVSTESPGRFGSREGGTSGSCSATGGRFTVPAGTQLQHTLPALSRKQGLSSTAHKIHASYFTEG